MAESCPDNNKPLSVAYPDTTKSSIVADPKTISAATPLYDVVNKMSSAARDYSAINGVVNQLLGYDVRWFRAIPQQRSKDVIFQEYTLSNVEEQPLCVKTILPTGMPPDSKYNFDLMGLEYEVPLEIQIDKKYWESIAGFGSAPQKKDIVYFVISNKLYEVESSYLFRGFMEQETTWKCNLIKYQPKASRKESAALQETIDQYTVSVEELFGQAIDNDVAKLVDDQQMNALNSTSKDKYKSFDVSLNTINKTMSIYGTVVAQSFYDMQSPIWYNAVTYNTEDLLGTTSNRAVMAWIQPRTIPAIHKEYNVSSITPIVGTLDISTMYQYDASLYSAANYTITLNTPISLSNIQIGNTVVVSRQGALNFYAKVVAISINPLKLYCAINAFVLEDLNTIKSDWNIQTGYKLMLKEPISVIDGVNDFGEHVLSVNICANQYIAISYGHTWNDSNDSYNAYVVRMDDKLNDSEWYGIVVNIGNSWKQYSAYVWKRHDSDKNAKLQNIFYETLRLYPEDIAVNQYSINKSPSYLTNLRLFNTTIEQEKQSLELLSYFTRDADQAIILDNADPLMHIPYISRQR